MTREDFLTALIADHEGACLARNLLDSVRIGNLPKPAARQFLDQCVAGFAFASPPNSGEALERAKAVAAGYRLAGTLFPVLTDYCRATKHVANVMRWEVFRAHYMKPEIANDDEYGFPESSLGWADEPLRLWANKGYLRQGDAPGGYLVAHIEVRNKALWATSRDSLDSAISSITEITDGANKAYDALGLIHLESGQVLVTLVSPFGEFQSGHAARPTALDGGNVRFRVICEDEERKGWGHTVDLNLLTSGSTVIQGCPETLLDPVSFAPRDETSWRLLGRLEDVRPRTDKADATFWARLLRDQTTVEIVAELTTL